MPRIFLGDPAKDSFEVSFIGAIQMRRPLKGSECNRLITTVTLQLLPIPQYSRPYCSLRWSTKPNDPRRLPSKCSWRYLLAFFPMWEEAYS